MGAEVESVTEKTVRDRLLNVFSTQRDLIGVNMLGVGPYLHEMDLIRVTKAGYATEFEIKVSASDIRAELKKKEKHNELWCGITRTVGHKYVGREEWQWNSGWREKWADEMISEPFVHGAYKSMAIRCRQPIREFYIAVPDDALAVLALELMPAWAGVVVASGGSRHWDGMVRRKAAKLPSHRKITATERLHLYERTYFRYWQMYNGFGGKGRG